MAHQPRRGESRIIDDNEDGSYFFGAGGFSAGEATAGVSEIERALDSLLELPDSGQPARAAGGRPPKLSGWAGVAKLHLPAQPRADAAAAAAAAPSSAASDAVDAKAGAPLCAFFLSGNCRFGDKCRFRHARADVAVIGFFAARLADVIAGGGGGGGAGEERGQGEEAGPGAGAPPPGDAAFQRDSDAWRASAATQRDTLLEEAVSLGVCATVGAAEVALHQAERNASADVECGICLEYVAEVPGRRFGLLTSCTHAFCVECIREWRGRIDLPVSTTRSCPLCRTLSYFIIPCDRFIADAGRKAAVHAAYHSSQRAIPCKHYDLGRGVCPFGASCFYEHRGLDGTLAAASGRHTFLMDSEGTITGGRAEYQLARLLRPQPGRSPRARSQMICYAYISCDRARIGLACPSAEGIRDLRTPTSTAASQTVCPRHAFAAAMPGIPAARGRRS